MGLPFTSGPVTLFLALDNGLPFAASSAVGSMLGVIAQTTFALAYAAVAGRAGRLVPALAAGVVAFAVVGAITEPLALAALPLFALIAVILVVAIRLVPDPGMTAAVALPRWDLPARMVVATMLVLALTSAAPLLGPRVSGLLATFPVYASILAAFGHSLVGPAAAIRVWRGLLFGLFGFGAFFLVLALALERFGIAVAFGLAILTALATQGVTLSLLRRGAVG